VENRGSKTPGKAKAPQTKQWAGRRGQRPFTPICWVNVTGEKKTAQEWGKKMGKQKKTQTQKTGQDNHGGKGMH